MATGPDRKALLSPSPAPRVPACELSPPLGQTEREALRRMAQARGDAGRGMLPHIEAAVTHEQGLALAAHLKAIPKQAGPVATPPPAERAPDPDAYQVPIADGQGHATIRNSNGHGATPTRRGQ
jgi:hypothetical protein